MKKFSVWLEQKEMIPGNILKLHDILLLFYKTGPWKNLNYHHSLLNSLKDAGFASDAKELELLNPTEEEIEYANQPYRYELTKSKMGEIFDLKRSHYSQKVEEILDKLDAQYDFDTFFRGK